MGGSPFMESLRKELRTRHYSLRTEKCYMYWVRSLIRFNGMLHPEQMNNTHIELFLNHLALDKAVSPATQNLALCAIVFMYRHLLHRELVGLEYGYARAPRNLPTVLSPQEVQRILSVMQGQTRLITALLYGAGLRINEALRMRVKDIRTVQELLGHTDLRTTEIYTHVVGNRRAGTISPFDIIAMQEVREPDAPFTYQPPLPIQMRVNHS